MHYLPKSFKRAMINDRNKRVEFNKAFVIAANQIEELKTIFLKMNNHEVASKAEDIESRFKIKEEANRSNIAYAAQNLVLAP